MTWGESERHPGFDFWRPPHASAPICLLLRAFICKTGIKQGQILSVLKLGKIERALDRDKIDAGSREERGREAAGVVGGSLASPVGG